jgi:hypothetical protein
MARIIRHHDITPAEQSRTLGRMKRRQWWVDFIDRAWNKSLDILVGVVLGMLLSGAL